MKNLFLIIFLLISSPAFGAIAYDSVSTASTTSATSAEWAHTIISNDNNILIVGVTTDDITDSDRDISGVTYGGVALTHIRTEAASGGEVQSSLWYITDVPIGEDVIIVSFGGSVSEIVVGAIAFTGVDISDPIDAHNGGVASSDTMSTAVTTTTDNAWVIDAGGWDSSGTITVDASQTQRVNAIEGTCSLGMSHEGPKTPAGEVTMSWTKSLSGQYSHSAVSINASTVVASSSSVIQAATIQGSDLN